MRTCYSYDIFIETKCISNKTESLKNENYLKFYLSGGRYVLPTGDSNNT